MVLAHFKVFKLSTVIVFGIFCEIIAFCQKQSSCCYRSTLFILKSDLVLFENYISVYVNEQFTGINIKIIFNLLLLPYIVLHCHVDEKILYGRPYHHASEAINIICCAIMYLRNNIMKKENFVPYSTLR